MSEKKRLECSGPIFMPHCKKYKREDGCLEEAGKCNYQYEDDEA